MAKFNAKSTIKTVNHEGHAAYAMQDKTRLITQVLTSFFDEKKFYQSNDRPMLETLRSVIRNDPQFVSNLAVFARREFGLRSVSHVLTCFLAAVPEGKPYARRTVRGVTLRGDDATEILAFYLNTFGKPIPNSLRKGLLDVIATFDAYTLAKYKGTGNDVKMRDLFRICRPHPETEEQSVLWKQVVDNTLPTPLTWETELSANGNTKESWEKLIASGRLPYMALLRNLRNIVSANPSNLPDALSRLSDPEAVRKSRQFPFRFLSAYRSLPASAGKKVFDALEAAASASVANLPRLPGRTVIAMDVSGSMSMPVSKNSEVCCCEIGMMLGLIANRICDDAVFYTFNYDLRSPTVPSSAGLLYACVHEANAFGGTDMSLPFCEMIQKKIHADRIIVISDNECNRGNRTIQSYANTYRKTVNAGLWVHAIDLLGYGTKQFTGPKTNIIAGWSEKVFDFILLAERGEETLQSRIASYTF